MLTTIVKVQGEVGIRQLSMFFVKDSNFSGLEMCHHNYCEVT